MSMICSVPSSYKSGFHSETNNGRFAVLDAVTRTAGGKPSSPLTLSKVYSPATAVLIRFLTSSHWLKMFGESSQAIPNSAVLRAEAWCRGCLYKALGAHVLFLRPI